MGRYYQQHTCLATPARVFLLGNREERRDGIALWMVCKEGGRFSPGEKKWLGKL